MRKRRKFNDNEIYADHLDYTSSSSSASEPEHEESENESEEEEEEMNESEQGRATGPSHSFGGGSENVYSLYKEALDNPSKQDESSYEDEEDEEGY